MNCCVLAGALLASLSAAHGQNFVSLDGVYNAANDGYTNSELVSWYNGHGKETAYGTFAAPLYQTTIRYGTARLAGSPSTEQFFFLFAEVPLYAKNMIWGSGTTAADWAEYRGGKALDYNGATGSEKMALLDSKGSVMFTADLGKSADSKFGLVGFKDSADFLIDNGISTIASSASNIARNTTMSFELQFKLDPVQNQKLIEYARNGIQFHLSPERLAPVPEPGSLLLLGLTPALLLRRRRR